MTIRITQLMCPQRHCILAAAWDSNDAIELEVCAQLRATMTELHLDPWCGLCGSRELSTETGSTRWETMEDALPALKQLETEQRVVAALFQSKK